MRVAALLAGEPRFCREFDLFLSNLKNYQTVDWYMYLWHNNDTDSRQGFNIIAPKWSKVDYDWAMNKFVEKLPPGHKVANLVLADKTQVLVPDIVNKAGETSVERMWGMYNSLYQVDLMRRASQQKYDLIIRARPDIGIKNIIDIEKFVKKVKENKNNLITPSTEVYGYGHRINDMIAFGSDYSMSIYCDAVKYIPEYHSQGLLFHPETMLAYHCQAQGLKVIEEDFGGIVLRKFGQQMHDGTYISDFGFWA